MEESIIERKLYGAVQEAVNNKVGLVLRGVKRIAAMQGGDSTLENYHLLGKRVIVVAGVVVAVQAVASAVGFVISRRNEKRRIERIVRRVLEEERQKEGAEA